jgi:hypothetical protein
MAVEIGPAAALSQGAEPAPPPANVPLVEESAPVFEGQGDSGAAPAQPVLPQADVDETIQPQYGADAAVADMSQFSISKNTRGENVISWFFEQSQQDIQTFIIIADYFGLAAPLGAIPCTGPGIYNFVDDILCAYVGEKSYGIMMVSSAGNVSYKRDVVRSSKRTSFPIGIMR